MLIRPMTATDLDDVTRLCDQLGYLSTPAQIAHRFGLLLDSSGNALFVAEGEDERVVGWVHVVGRVYLDSDPFAQVGGIVVDDRYRGQGVGAALMAAAERWAAERGYDEMRLWTNVRRDGAHAFYERLGYTHSKTSRVYRKSLP
jgi:GNAT superfamily N-acetyltransferase